MSDDWPTTFPLLLPLLQASHQWFFLQATMTFSQMIKTYTHSSNRFSRQIAVTVLDSCTANINLFKSLQEKWISSSWQPGLQCNILTNLDEGDTSMDWHNYCHLSTVLYSCFVYKLDNFCSTKDFRYVWKASMTGTRTKLIKFKLCTLPFVIVKDWCWHRGSSLCQLFSLHCIALSGHPSLHFHACNLAFAANC